ncbi:hypothetical protein [Candidatus Lokiarchaeum ossiferum]|uniref:hypothetical protein n=1 Tax=Candidatus Lokiarchaeum ossiferum TaxID=2951803 RepID=UPI00352F47F0
MTTNREKFALLSKSNPVKFGLICLECLFEHSSVEDLHKFALIQALINPEDHFEKDTILTIILDYYLSSEIIEKRLKKEKLNKVELIGKDICTSQVMQCNLAMFDFIAKSDLINIFADYCADLKINVFQNKKDEEYNIDLYLTKKDPRLKTESVFILTGNDIQEKYRETFLNIERAGEISDWKIFVTTPVGVLKIGYERLLVDMKKLNCWLYVVDPVQEQIFGILKGGKSKREVEELRNAYISKLPSTPIRAASQVVKISKYAFSEKQSYRPKDVQLFYIPENSHNLMEASKKNLKYQDIFKNLLIISNDSGLSMFSHATKLGMPLNELMISGFLSAMDSFIEEISGGKGMLNEVDYQNFKINAAVGKYAKMFAITSDSVDDSFRERLNYLNNYLEERYQTEIEGFIKTGNLGNIDESEWVEAVHKILLV